MKKIILIFFIIYLNLLANNLNIKAYAIGIFDQNGSGENIQHKRNSIKDYNGTCFSKIVIFGNYNIKDIKVTIGTSIGHFEKAKSIFNDKKMKIAQELTFKHYNITKGYFEVRVKNKLYDSKVFIK
jgi:hypothetical protein